MLIRLVYLVFIISAAFASAGILLSSRLKNRYGSDLFSALLFYQVFIFTFGFYDIWGQVILRVFLSGYVSQDNMLRIIDISSLLGLPFLIFAWLMQIRFSLEVTGRKAGKWLIFWFLFLNFAIIFGVGIYITDVKHLSPSLLIRYYYIGFNFIYSMIAGLLITNPVNDIMKMQKYEGRILSYGLIMVMVVQCITLYLYREDPWIGLAFIFTFFAGNAFAPLYLSYGITMSVFTAKPARDLTFEDFCRKYEISPRESDIVREICNGLSNQEISDKLFISLQTVKDHTHRIYIKTNVKSRVQLMNLVRETGQV